MDERHRNKLKKRKEEGTLRSLSHFEGFVDFFSNDYLGMAQDEYVASLSGSTGSRLISGTTQAVLDAEATMAGFFGAEAALMFNSGYDANLGFFSVVPHRDDTVLYDEYIHASVRDGIRLGHARNYSFKHNDLKDLEKHLQRWEGIKYVAVESLYSMDGDFAELPGLLELCERYEAWLVIDEAHAAGIFGEQGRGLGVGLKHADRILARLVTFGKAYGSHGACWLGSHDLINFLSNFSRSFIYTTALPEAVYVHNASILTDRRLGQRREKLAKNIAYFREIFESENLISSSESPIQIVETGDVQKAKMLAEKLHEAQIAVKPIYAPTVPEGRERIRLCLHTFNTREQIDNLVAALS